MPPTLRSLCRRNDLYKTLRRREHSRFHPVKQRRIRGETRNEILKTICTALLKHSAIYPVFVHLRAVTAFTHIGWSIYLYCPMLRNLLYEPARKVKLNLKLSRSDIKHQISALSLSHE